MSDDHRHDREDEYQRSRRANDAYGYTSSGPGVNQNDTFGTMRTPHDMGDSSPAWVKLLSLMILVCLVVVAMMFIL